MLGCSTEPQIIPIVIKREKMSSSDLLTKFDDLVKRFKAEFNEVIEGERAKLRAEVEAFNEEKEKMKGLDVSDDDIIRLNVGGQKFTTTRSTLCQVEGSLLATMFSGRWEDAVKRDEDGAVFFDFNPQYFGYILDYLRAKRIATPEKPAPLPKVEDQAKVQDQAKNFDNLVEYLGLSSEIDPTEIALSEKFNLRSSGVILEEDGKVAVNDSSGGHKYVLSENVYKQGTVRHKLKIESFQDNPHWIMVGIVKADVVPQGNRSYDWPRSYGWSLGDNGQVYKDGSHSINESLKKLSKQGDMVELVLDCDAGKLSLHLPTGQQFDIDIPKSQTWRLHVNLHGANDKIRIVEVLQA